MLATTRMDGQHMKKEIEVKMGKMLDAMRSDMSNELHKDDDDIQHEITEVKPSPHHISVRAFPLCMRRCVRMCVACVVCVACVACDS